MINCKVKRRDLQKYSNKTLTCSVKIDIKQNDAIGYKKKLAME